jgi:hypothetical protein
MDDENLRTTRDAVFNEQNKAEEKKCKKEINVNV